MAIPPRMPPAGFIDYYALLGVSTNDTAGMIRQSIPSIVLHWSIIQMSNLPTNLPKLMLPSLLTAMLLRHLLSLDTIASI